MIFRVCPEFIAPTNGDFRPDQAGYVSQAGERTAHAVHSRLWRHSNDTFSLE